MRVLIGCETSGVVRRAFLARGHDAWSCDLEPSEDRSNRHCRRHGQPVERVMTAGGTNLVDVIAFRICESVYRVIPSAPNPDRACACRLAARGPCDGMINAANAALAVIGVPLDDLERLRDGSAVLRALRRSK
jgi:hypothetical protein